MARPRISEKIWALGVKLYSNKQKEKTKFTGLLKIMTLAWLALKNTCSAVFSFRKMNQL